MKTQFALIALVAVVGCKPKHGRLTVQLTNKLPLERTEMISIPMATLDSMGMGPGTSYVVLNGQTEKPVRSQLVDNDGDGTNDELIFQAPLAANQTSTWYVEASADQPDTIAESRAYSRFVPERIDDYAWENDRVAFRTYGPEAQRLVDEKQPGGTLSSGIDCWLKRVDYPVIDKWYKKNLEGGSYHTDTGEGYDPYHVGASRGCGGVGVWINDSLYVSKNFITYKRLANGPLRTIVELTYAPYTAGTATITEKKRITLDVGTQLSKVEVMLNASAPIPNTTIGITLHEKKGEVKIDSVLSYASYWEQIDDAYLGTGVVVDPAYAAKFLDYRTTKKDLSHLYITVLPGRPLVYYAGFGWEKAGRIKTRDAWNNYLAGVAQCIQSPVAVTLKR